MSDSPTIDDIYKLFEKTNEQFEKTNEQFEKSQAEFDARFAKLEKTVAETNKAVGNLFSRWGHFVEELVEPAAIALFRARGIDVKETYTRARTRRQGFAMEIDILVVDETELVAIECKSRLTQEDVDYFLKKLSRFKESFPHYKDYAVYGAVAGIEVDQGVDRYAYKKGLFVIKPSGETVTIVNNEAFNAHTW